MPRDASGHYTLPPTNPVVHDTFITTDWANGTLSDIATQLNGVVTRDGLLTFTAQLRATDGTVAAPGVSFAGQTGTGLSRHGTEMRASAAGVHRMTWTATSVDIPGASVRLTANFSDAAVENRTLLQTNVANQLTDVGAIPSGTSTTAEFTAYNNSTPTNSGTVTLAATATEAVLEASRVGTGTALPLSVRVLDGEAVRVATNRDVTVQAGLGVTGTATLNNVHIAGTGRRITGLFDGAVASRTMFQTSTANQFSSVGVLPNGTSNHGSFVAYRNADLANSPWTAITADSTEAFIGTNADGTGTPQPVRMGRHAGGIVRCDHDSIDLQATHLRRNGAPMFRVHAWAWVSNGNTLRSNGNISSMHRNGVGDITLNLISFLPTTEAALAGSVSMPGMFGLLTIYPHHARYMTRDHAGNPVDPVATTVIVVHT